MFRSSKRNAQPSRLDVHPGRRGPTRRDRARFRPNLDALEGRALLASFLVSSTADAGPGSLRQAIADANATPGADVVTFASSLRNQTITLASPINIADSLTLHGPGANRLTISGGGTTNLLTSAPAMTIEDFYADVPPIDITIEGLTLADGRLTGFDFPNFGSGAALFTYRANVTVRDTVWRNNQAGVGSGGAISVLPGQVVDENFNFVKLIPVTFAASDSTFRANRAASAGAVRVQAATATIHNSQFIGNAAGSPFAGSAVGGAIASTGGDLEVSGSRFEANSATATSLAWGGAISVSTGGSVTLADSTFVGNHVEAPGSFFASGIAFGGAVRVEGASAIIVANSRFRDNRAAGESVGAGGAIDATPAFGTGTMTIRDSEFLGNEAAGLPIGPGGGGFGFPSAQGGAVRSAGGPLVVEASLFRDNRAVGADNPFNDGGAGLGGAIANLDAELIVRNSRFTDNLARGGRGGSGAPNGGGFVLGGAVYNLFGSATILDSRFDGNTANGGDATRPGSAGGIAQGGGVCLVGGDAQVLTNVTFIDNRVRGGTGSPANPDAQLPGGRGGDGDGGALYLEQTPATLTGGRFVGNKAWGGNSPDGTAGDAHGGAISSRGSLIARDVRISASRAFGGTGLTGGNAQGGGLFAAGALFTFDSTITGNQAIAGPSGGGFGGGIYLAPGTVAVLKRTTVTGNKATTAGNQIFGTFTI
jgi:fibronectin-binding autotransporter adhesin